MMRAIYRPGDSVLHRVPAGAKLLALALLAIWVGIGGWREALAGGVAVGAGWTMARLAAADALAALRGFAVLAAIIFIAQALLLSPNAAALIVAKLAILVLGATLVSMTTKVADMLAVLDRVLAPLKVVGISPEQASFLIVLAIRFIPAISRIAAEVREAQRARGLERQPFAAAVPIMIRTDAVSEALAARGWSPR